MRKREFLRGSVLTMLATTGLTLRPGKARAKTRAPDGKRLNLLIITVDDMDVSLMGYMGNRHGLTPNLDTLAQRSHVFEQNRGAAPICMPSRQAFMSGLVPHRNSPGGFTPMYEGTQSICSILKKEGWYCAASHKLEHMQPESSFPWDDKAGGEDRNILSHAAEFNRAVAAAKADGRPFFVNCNVNDPHRPFYGSRPAAKRDNDDQGPYGIPRPVSPSDVEVPPFLEDLPEVRIELSQYWNSVQRADLAIGQLLKALDESGEAANTVIVFCNDHGMPFPFSKGTGYDHGTRVPAMVSYPGMAAPKRFQNLACNVDIMPTALDLLGVAIPKGIDGRSWVSRMRGETVADPEFIVTYVNGVAVGDVFPVRTIQDHRYSLIYQPWSDGQYQLRIDSMSGLTLAAMRRAGETDPKVAQRVHDYVFGVPISFFDRQEDPGERNNLINAPEHKARIAHMRDALLREMERTKDPQLTNVRTMIAGGKPVVDHSVPQGGRRGRRGGGGGRRGRGGGAGADAGAGTGSED